MRLSDCARTFTSPTELAPVRVFHLVKGLGRGGAETLLVRTASTELLTSRRNGYGYFLPWKDALVSELREQGCVVKCFLARNPAEMILRLPELVAFLRNWRPDLIHGHLPLAGVMARLAGKALGVPVVYTEHNLQERYHPLTRLVNRLTWKMQDRVVAVSAEVRDSILRALPEETPLQVVLNGVDCEKFSPRPSDRATVRAEFGLSEDDILIGTVAVFRKQKRLDLWLEVARRLALEFPNVYFALIGDGPERPLVERLVAEYGLDDRMRLPGLLANVCPYYCALDAFFMSSDFEGLPVALLEAMASGVPAVVTTAGGIGEVIQGSDEGLVAPVGDLETLYSHLRTLCLDRVVARELGRNGRARVRTAFSLARMSRELEDLYVETLGQRVRPEPKLTDYDYVREVSADESIHLIRLALGEGSERSPRTLEFFIWKHEATPFGRSYRLGARAGVDGELAGLRLFQRWRLVRDAQTFEAVRAVDTSTHPEHQRRGIFTALTLRALQDLTEENSDLVFNTPNRNSLPGYLKMGWELADQISLKVKWLGGRAHSTSSAGCSLDDILGDFSPSDIDGLLEQTRVPGKLQIAKSLSYLKWRYSEHPTVSYLYAAQSAQISGEIEALLVWCETRRARLSEFTVCELFARSEGAAQEVLRAAFAGSRCHYAVWVSSSSPVAEAAIDEQGFKVLPFKKLALTVYPLSERANLGIDGSSWCFSTGDLQVF